MVERMAWKPSSPFFIQGSRSMPIERILRTICPGDSSKAKYRQRSPRWHAAFANAAEMLVLPAPAVPDTSTVVPR